MEGVAENEFGRLVRRYRDERSMSQDRLGKLVHRTDGYISQLESGTRGKRLSRDMVVAIAQALNAPVNELLAAAGHDPVDSASGRSRFVTAVETDPLLRSDQKRLILDLYSLFVGRID